MDSTTLFTTKNGIAGSISREEMASLPIRRYEGTVRLVATPQDLDELKPRLLDVLFPQDGQTSPLHETEYTQPVLFANCSVQVESLCVIHWR